jgi:hypothetical protein
MHLTRKWGVILLSVFLILLGLNYLVSFTFHVSVILGILAIAAGVLLLIDR